MVGGAMVLEQAVDGLQRRLNVEHHVGVAGEERDRGRGERLVERDGPSFDARPAIRAAQEDEVGHRRERRGDGKPFADSQQVNLDEVRGTGQEFSTPLLILGQTVTAFVRGEKDFDYRDQLA